MKLSNSKYNLLIPLTENEVTVLVVENQDAYTSIVANLNNQCIGLEGDFILSRNNKELRIDKNASFVIDPININFNDRKIINKLYLELAMYANENLEEEKSLINTEIIKSLDQIVSSSRYDNLEFELGYQWIDLFKFYNVKIASEFSSLSEKLVEYIKVLSSICNIQLLFLVNLKAYINENELKEIYRMAGYYKLHLFLIESCEKVRLDSENVYIIDKDLCFIEK